MSNGDQTIFRKIGEKVKDYVPEAVAEEVEQEILKQENRIMKWIFGLATLAATGVVGFIVSVYVMQYQVNVLADEQATYPSAGELAQIHQAQTVETAHVAEAVSENKDALETLDEKFDDMKEQQVEDKNEILDAIREIR